LEEIEGYLLTEPRKILEGADVSKAEIERAKQILAAVKQADKENAETVAEQSGLGT
jgi:hypothetical protein